MSKRKTTAGGYDDSSDGLDLDLDTSPNPDSKRSKSAQHAPPRVTMGPRPFQYPGSTRGARHVSAPVFGRTPLSSGRATPAPPSSGRQTPVPDYAQVARNTPEVQMGKFSSELWFV
jgi:hypothetical protein